MRGAHSAILGSLLGTAVGDAMGLPYEGLSRRRVAALGKIRHRFFFGRGMFSDDTEHTLMVASAMIRHGDNVAAFQRLLGWKLRCWILALPAGIGLGTARAIIRLWLAFPASRSGVRSAGNGAAMRSAIIGVLFHADTEKRHEFAIAACRVTHSDPRAIESAILVSEAAALATRHASQSEVLEALKPLVVSDEMQPRFVALVSALKVGTSVLDFAAEIGCGQSVSGFAPNSVAVALYAWLRHRGDFEQIITLVIACGGDTDTVAAIAGGISGAEVGEDGIPKIWIDGIRDWPRSVSYIRQMAVALSDHSERAPQCFWPAIAIRNALFLLVVLLHGLRRLLPPY